MSKDPKTPESSILLRLYSFGFSGIFAGFSGINGYFSTGLDAG
jgi:hypothetical protein